MPYNVMKATALLSILIEENFVVILSANVLYITETLFTELHLFSRPGHIRAITARLPAAIF